MQNMQNMHKSLDDILRDIERESSQYPPLSSAGTSVRSQPSMSAGMHNISAHITPIIDAAQTPQPDERATQTEVWETQLSPRQKLLPKLDLRMIAGIVSIFVLTIGIGSATYLTQQTQDLRQQAYEETLPTVHGTPATQTTTDEESLIERQKSNATPSLAEQQAKLSQQVTVFGGIIVGISSFLLISFLLWLFFY